MPEAHLLHARETERIAHELRNSLAAMRAALRLLTHEAGNVELERQARETLAHQLDAIADAIEALERGSGQAVREA